MSAFDHIEILISRILYIGILISTALVIFGGTLYLWQNGSQPVPFELLRINPIPNTFNTIVSLALSFTPLGIIELGLLVLVLTQILRVMLLFLFYLISRDFLFTGFSFFILITLIYSLLYRR
jgi:uncharacterized membrane protein